MAGLVPDLQHILFWMSNSVELLYFIQQKCPLYMQSLEEELDVTGAGCRSGASGGRGDPWGGSGLAPLHPRLESAAQTKGGGAVSGSL